MQEPACPIVELAVLHKEDDVVAASADAARTSRSFHRPSIAGVAMFLEIDGNKVFSLSFGSGPRTLLAHSGWVGNFEDWIATLAPLSGRWRTVVYDHRGAGETQVPVGSISVDAMVSDVFGVMDALGIE